jgi:hypothetical protein
MVRRSGARFSDAAVMLSARMGVAIPLSYRP